MPRFLLALILLASCCLATANEPAPTTASRFVAKVKFLRVDGGKQIMAVNTEVTGTKGTPLKTNLGGKDGLTLRLEMRDVPDIQPSQYIAQFKLVETDRDKDTILSQPAIMTTAGTPAKVMVGTSANRIEVELVVREIGAASPAASRPASTAGGKIIMGGVNPRIIIQEEEEEKLGIPAP